MTVKDEIVQKVQKMYGYEVAYLLQQLSECDMSAQAKSVCQRSTDTNMEAKAEEQYGMDMMYQAKVNDYIKRSNLFTQNLWKSYAVIWEYCSKQLQNTIKTRVDFKTTIQDEPIELLKTIKIVMHEPERSKYPYALIMEAFKRVINIRQKENESLIDYSKRIKQAKDVLVAHVGKDILGGCVTNTPKYQAAPTTGNNRRDIKMACFNEWTAYLLITNSEQSKYASLTNGLASQYSMKNNQYPKSILSTTDIMKNHGHDDEGKQKDKYKGTHKHKHKDKEEGKEEEQQPPQTGNDANFAQ